MEKNFAGGARSNEEKVPDPAYTFLKELWTKSKGRP